MKKNLALSSILSMLGALSIATPQSMAYKLDVVSNENILHQETVLDKLEKYESQALAKLATALKEIKLDPDSIITLALSLDGSIHGFTYRDPGATIKADSPERKALKDVRTLNFGKVPSLESGYIKLTLPFKELVEGNYKRKLYVVQTPEGQSIGGVGGINIGNVIGNVPARAEDISHIQKRMARQREPEPVAYSSKDRKFDSDIASIYSAIRARPSAFRPFDRDRDDKTDIKEIEELSKTYMKQENFLAAAQSYLNEAKYFLRISDLEQGKARFEKVKNLLSRLQLPEKESLIKSTTQTSSQLARGNENFSCREYLLLETYNMAKSTKGISLNLELDTIQALADFYLSAGQKNDALNYYKQMLTQALKSKENAGRTAQIYTKLASAQKSMKDTVACDKTLTEANRYLEKSQGKNSVTLIPVLLMMIQNTSDSKIQESKLDRIESIVDNYKSLPTDDSRSSRDQDARRAADTLMNESHTTRYRRYNDPASSSQLILAADCARLGYKLKLKAEPRFDYFAFTQLVRTMQSAGQFEQTANLYKETIAMLESSQDRSTSHHADSLRRSYLNVLEQAKKTTEADKLKAELKDKDEAQLADHIKRLEERLNSRTNLSASELVQNEVNLFGAYAKQKNAIKTNEVLTKILADLKSIDELDRNTRSAGFTMIGPVRTQSEFFQQNPKMEETLIKVILLLDEKTKNGLDSMAMNTLTLRTMGSDKNELANKIAKAIEESRQGRSNSTRRNATGANNSASLDAQIETARANRDKAEIARLQREKLNNMIASKEPNFRLVQEALNLSRAYIEADQQQEAERAFKQALTYFDNAKPVDVSRASMQLASAASYQIMKKRFDLAELGLRKYADLMAQKHESEDRFSYNLSSFDSLIRAFIQNNEFDKAISFQRDVLSKLEANAKPDKKIICQERLALSLTLLRVANRDSSRKDVLMKESETEFNKALSEMKSYFGPQSNQVQSAIKGRLRELKSDDLQAIESLKKLQEQ
ncbi:MAG: hypothetical protein KIT34_04670 [Cyanobacteria bacterium TGS_CYA1]|nr:hypothetical protein [Cyanobacteria bacterium TGS_CYA1]